MEIKIGNINSAQRVIKGILLNSFFILVIAVLSHFTAEFFGRLYYLFIPYYGSIFFSTRDFDEYLIGIFLAFSLFLPLIFTTFGGKYKYWWVVVLLIPILTIFILADIIHIYFPIILGLAGWGIGLVILRVFQRPGKTA